MKTALPLIALILLSLIARSQVTPIRRSVRFHTIGKDSINLSLNEDYEMIEDSCTTITRYGHLNLSKRQFNGKFKDISHNDPNLILSEGTYDDDGLKNGAFISHYNNGVLQSKGSFKDNKFDGKWEVYYDNGKPKMNFEANGDVVKVNDQWNEKGAKTIDNGKGGYTVDLGYLTWSGKLLNGMPDGTWIAIRSGDATETTIIKESFKKGVFQKGNNTATGDYSEKSRITFISDALLPYLTAEKLRISRTPCNGVKQAWVVYAQYSMGAVSYSDEIARRVSQYLNRIDLKAYDQQLTLNASVSEYGTIFNFFYQDAFSPDIANGIIAQLKRLPSLNPGTADGKPIKQKFTIVFNFRSGSYNFSWHVSSLPITKP
jgi:antitoxin component YwqK of YwqJK toxin-antitoxin module